MNSKFKMATNTGHLDIMDPMDKMCSLSFSLKPLNHLKADLAGIFIYVALFKVLGFVKLKLAAIYMEVEFLTGSNGNVKNIFSESTNLIGPRIYTFK
jgi:hypothetical protein